MEDFSILVVDDEAFVCENVALKIGRLNHKTCYTVKSCNSVKSALELLQKETFDLIITDIRMPFITGLQFISMLKEQRCTSKIFVLSGHDDFHYVKESFLSGADDYLLKPISVSELGEKLEKIVMMAASKRLENSDEKTEVPFESIIEKAKAYITKNSADKNLSMSEVADYVYLSYSHFSNLFNKKVGMSFRSYLRNVRIQKAIVLLKDSRVRISDICYKVGFKYPQQFSNDFKKVTGLYPTEYNSRCKKKIAID